MEKLSVDHLRRVLFLLGGADPKPTVTKGGVKYNKFELVQTVHQLWTIKKVWVNYNVVDDSLEDLVYVMSL